MPVFAVSTVRILGYGRGDMGVVSGPNREADREGERIGEGEREGEEDPLSGIPQAERLARSAIEARKASRKMKRRCMFFSCDSVIIRSMEKFMVDT